MSVINPPQTIADNVHQVQISLNIAGFGTIKVDGHDLSNKVAGVDFHSRPGDVSQVTLHMPQAVEFDGLALVTVVAPAADPDTATLRAEVERLQQLVTCPHGATAEELCNRLPSDAELAEMRAAQPEVERLRSAAAREKIRADGAEARLARANGPAVSEAPAGDETIERIVQAVVALAHGPLVAADEQAAEGEAAVALPTRAQIAQAIQNSNLPSPSGPGLYDVNPDEAADAVLALLTGGQS